MLVLPTVHPLFGRHVGFTYSTSIVWTPCWFYLQYIHCLDAMLVLPTVHPLFGRHVGFTYSTSIVGDAMLVLPTVHPLFGRHVLLFEFFIYCYIDGYTSVHVVNGCFYAKIKCI